VLHIINSSSNNNREEQATVPVLVHWITFTMVKPTCGSSKVSMFEIVIAAMMMAAAMDRSNAS